MALRREGSLATGFHRSCAVASIILREPFRLAGAMVSTGAEPGAALRVQLVALVWGMKQKREEAAFRHLETLRPFTFTHHPWA